MSVFLQPIYTQTVGSGGVNTVTFNNIPQGFTDIMVKASIRGTASAATVGAFMAFNGSSANSSYRLLYGDGSAAGSVASTGLLLGDANAATSTSNTFSSHEFYMPNYAGSNFKSYVLDSVTEQNGTAVYSELAACLWRNTSALTSVLFQPTSGNFAQYTTFSLYGITKG